MLKLKAMFMRVHRLTALHTSVFCLIAFLTIFRQVLVLEMLQQENQTGQVIGWLGQQELYSQQISKDVMALETLQNAVSRQSYRVELQRILPRWQKMQSSLQPLGSAQPLSGKMNIEAARLFREAQPQYQGITDLAEAVLAGQTQIKQVVNPLLSYDHQYLSRIGQVLILDEETSGIHTMVFHDVEILCFILTLIILLFELLVIFRPAMKRRAQLAETMERTAESLRTNEERIHTVLMNAPVVMFTLDMQGIYTFFEGHNLECLGFNTVEMIGQSIFGHQRVNNFFSQTVRKVLAGQTLRVVERYDALVFDMNMKPIYDQSGIQTGMIGVATNITERVQAEETLHHQLLHDSLTNLPNRNLLHERLDQSLQNVTWKEESLALLMLDLDHFRDINDTFGHHYGDLLLQQVAERLNAVLDKEVTVARLGGDEFAILLPGVNQSNLEASIQPICKALDEQFVIAEHKLQVKSSIGVALAPLHGSDGLTLLRRADVAMYRAKQQHRSYQVYDMTYEEEGASRLALLGAMRDATTNEQMYLNYQPKIDVQSGQISGVEALLRWQHPVYGFVAPDKFIPLAEQSGMITQLTRWVLESALKQSARWFEMGHRFSMAVNLSMLDLQDTDLPEYISALLQKYQVPANMLHLELTESALMTNPDQALVILDKLSGLGMRITIDDFGTGYSSLSYLKRLPVNELKIDRSFVMHMATVKEDATIVQSTISLAHNLGLKVVAEGVEDLETSQLLGTLNCDTIQGYYYSRPLSATALEQWLGEMSVQKAA
jgi:diguanylate cyclase (GGDEF)-like protein/PAS domain S-box-containing protein